MQALSAQFAAFSGLSCRSLPTQRCSATCQPARPGGCRFRSKSSLSHMNCRSLWLIAPVCRRSAPASEHPSGAAEQEGRESEAAQADQEQGATEPSDCAPAGPRSGWHMVHDRMLSKRSVLTAGVLVGGTGEGRHRAAAAGGVQVEQPHLRAGGCCLTASALTIICCWCARLGGYVLVRKRRSQGIYLSRVYRRSSTTQPAAHWQQHRHLHQMCGRS